MKGSFEQGLRATLLPAQDDEVLELDELWSYVGHKKNKVWIWVVLCRRTRQIIAWMWGDRSASTCELLWMKVPASYKKALCYSDLLAAYQKVLGAHQHQACTKQEGQTNHVERFNLTLRQRQRLAPLRQRLARFVRKTLAFSKNLFMHIVTLRLFFHTYNQQQALRYLKSHPT